MAIQLYDYSSVKLLNIRNILTILRIGLKEEEIQSFFDITEKELENLLTEAMVLGEIRNIEGRYYFAVQNFEIDQMEIPVEEIRKFLYCYWKEYGLDYNKYEETYSEITKSLSRSKIDFAYFGFSVGEYAEKMQNEELALKIYRYNAKFAQTLDISNKKTIFIKTVNRLSKLEFMRGVSPEDTLSLQREAVRLINQANLTAQDALLFIYAGMGEHFGGSYEEGTILREKGIKYLKQFDYENLESEALPLMVWHYYLEGDFRKTIAYYESFILAVENRMESQIITFAYPPVIFSYFFMCEYSSALALAQSIYQRAERTDDKLAGNLIKAIVGRIYIYLKQFELADKILTESNEEGKKLNYGWGRYYALYGKCQLEQLKGNYAECREILDKALTVAYEDKFAPIVASPFFLETLKGMEENGIKPLEDYDYKSEIKKYINSNNVHLKGIAYRHLGEIAEKEEKSNAEIINDYRMSIYYLDLSGNLNELGKSCVDLAELYFRDNDIENASMYANRAWRYFVSQDRDNFPDNIKGLLVNENSLEVLESELEGTWLELKDIINEERLETRLLTSLCRTFNLESGVFSISKRSGFDMKMAHNLDRRYRTEEEFQRVEGIISQVANTGTVFMHKENEAVQASFERKETPSSIIAIPFKHGGQVTSVLYLQSYLNIFNIDETSIPIIEKFAEKMGETIFSAMNYERLTETAITSAPLVTGSAGEENYCTSMDDEVLFIDEQIEKVAKANIPVLIIGETGVGKEVFARKVFEKSEYQKTFIKVNCGAIPATLIESELFGYEKGSFTGASARKKGYFELAEGGTIFLDEIGELPLMAQVKLLRVLQEHEIMRVGGTESIKVDFRLVAATNKDLFKEVKAGNFRKDLYYRLNVVQLNIPPLRNRKKDIPNLASFFIGKACKELNKPMCSIEPNTLVEMLNYTWPGNIRELENAIQKAVIFADDNMIKIDFSDMTGEGEYMSDADSLRTETEKRHVSYSAEVDLANELTLEEVERRYIKAVLDKCNGKVSGRGGACEILGLKRTTLISKMEKLGIKRN